MSDTKEFFLSVTQRIFSNWTALRMAVEHGMGSKERAVDFCPYMTEVMYMNENLSSTEVATELEDYMEEYFSTELQDDSAIQIAEELLRFHRYCIENNENVATIEFGKLPPLQSWLVTNEPVKKIHSSYIMENDSSESETEASGDVKVEDEWVEVRTRRKR
nr:uncharacterized protein LOC117600642 [Osmia lignaria]